MSDAYDANCAWPGPYSGTESTSIGTSLGKVPVQISRNKSHERIHGNLEPNWCSRLLRIKGGHS